MSDIPVDEESVVNMTVFDHAPAAVKARTLEGGDRVLSAWWETLSDWQQRMILAEAQRRIAELKFKYIMNRGVSG